VIPGVRLVLLGKQGAGKGTQAVKLAKHYVVPHISTGDMFRATVRSGSPLGEKLGYFMEAGELVPDAVVIEVVETRLREDDSRTRGFVLDGFPRTRPQAEELQAVLEPLGGLDVALDLEVPTDIVMARLSGRRACSQCGANYHVEAPPQVEWTCDVCGGEVVHRADDTPDAIARRLALYEQETEPLLGFYRELGLLCVVEGVGLPNDVFSRAVEAVDARRERARV
jgi:adenylate kinase